MSEFYLEQRRAWMRLHDHVVVNERDADFEQFRNDPSGSILRIVRIWANDSNANEPSKQHYIGCVRHCDCGGWVSSRRELSRLFHRATDTARDLGEEGRGFRKRLSRLLRRSL